VKLFRCCWCLSMSSSWKGTAFLILSNHWRVFGPIVPIFTIISLTLYFISDSPPACCSIISLFSIPAIQSFLLISCSLLESRHSHSIFHQIGSECFLLALISALSFAAVTSPYLYYYPWHAPAQWNHYWESWIVEEDPEVFMMINPSLFLSHWI